MNKRYRIFLNTDDPAVRGIPLQQVDAATDTAAIQAYLTQHPDAPSHDPADYYAEESPA